MESYSKEDYQPFLKAKPIKDTVNTRTRLDLVYGHPIKYVNFQFLVKTRFSVKTWFMVKDGFQSKPDFSQNMVFGQPMAFGENMILVK